MERSLRVGTRHTQVRAAMGRRERSPPEHPRRVTRRRELCEEAVP